MPIKKFGKTFLLSTSKKIDMNRIKELDTFNIFKKDKSEDADANLVLMNKEQTLYSYINSCEQYENIDGLYYFDYYSSDLPEAIDLLNLNDIQKKIIGINYYCNDDIYNKYDFFPKELSLTLVKETYIYLLDICCYDYDDNKAIMNNAFNILNTIFKENDAVYVVLSEKLYVY